MAAEELRRPGNVSLTNRILERMDRERCCQYSRVACLYCHRHRPDADGTEELRLRGRPSDRGWRSASGMTESGSATRTQASSPAFLFVRSIGLPDQKAGVIAERGE